MSQANISVVEAGSIELPTATLEDYLQQQAETSNPSSAHEAALRLETIKKGLETLYFGFQHAEDVSSTKAEQTYFHRMRCQVGALQVMASLPARGARA